MPDYKTKEWTEMKKILLAVALVCLMASPCFAEGVIFEQVISVLSGTTRITSVPDDIQAGIVQVTAGDPVKMTFSNNTVSSTVGLHLALYGTYEFRTRGELTEAMFTVASGSGASLYVIGYDYKNK